MDNCCCDDHKIVTVYHPNGSIEEVIETNCLGCPIHGEPVVTLPPNYFDVPSGIPLHP